MRWAIWFARSVLTLGLARVMALAIALTSWACETPLLLATSASD